MPRIGVNSLFLREENSRRFLMSNPIRSQRQSPYLCSQPDWAGDRDRAPWSFLRGLTSSRTATALLCCEQWAVGDAVDLMRLARVDHRPVAFRYLGVPMRSRSSALVERDGSGALGASGGVESAAPESFQKKWKRGILASSGL